MSHEMVNHSEESESGLQVYRTWDSLVDRVVCNASMKHDLDSEDEKKVTYQTKTKQVT